MSTNPSHFLSAASLSRASTRLKAFMTRGFWRFWGQPAQLDDYGGPRPWMHFMENWDDYHAVQKSYDGLLKHYGPRADIAVPRPPAYVEITEHGGRRSLDALFQLGVSACGPNLETLGRLRLEEAAFLRGAWVVDRLYAVRPHRQGESPMRWKRMGEDGGIAYETSQPADAFVADLSALAVKPAAPKPGGPRR